MQAIKRSKFEASFPKSHSYFVLLFSALKQYVLGLKIVHKNM